MLPYYIISYTNGLELAYLKKAAYSRESHQRPVTFHKFCNGKEGSFWQKLNGFGFKNLYR